MIANMDAVLVHYEKAHFDGGLILETVIWQVPEPVGGSIHHYKYRFFFGTAGRRLIGYDNERGKGDHRHHGDDEEPYVFISRERLLEDFFAEVEQYLADHAD
jgi:hypothetical protein